MRAQRVYENIDFERGRDPKSAMDVGLISQGKTIIPSGEYDVWLWYYPSSYAAQRKTKKSIHVEEQIVEFDDSYTWEIDGISYVKVKPIELLPLENAYDRRNPSGGGSYFVMIPDPRETKVYENIDFERGIDPKRSMGIGKYRTDNTFVVKAITGGWEPIRDEYDQRKFLQNLEMGLFPANFEVIGHRFNMPDEDKHIYAHELKGFDWVEFKGKFYKVG